MAAQGQRRADDLFGHPARPDRPRDTEMWERFSFFGMQALLMLYMTKYLLLPEHARRRACAGRIPRSALDDRRPDDRPRLRRPDLRHLLRPDCTERRSSAPGSAIECWARPGR